MAFTVSDLRDLTRLLLERPEWLGEVRRIVLTDELLSLPDIVRGLAEAQRRTEERLEQLTARVDQLTEAQRRTEQSLNLLVQAVHGLENEMYKARGILLEMRYRNRATSYFGRWLRKPRVVDVSDIWDDLEDKLSLDEIRELSNVDLLVRGQLHRKAGSGDMWLAVEVSNVIDEQDIERAIRRAELLRKAGFRSVPVVAGHNPLDTEVAEEIAESHVALLMNGSSAGWDEALSHALAGEQT